MLDKNKVYVSQIGVLLLLIMSGTKILIFPALIAKQVGHDSWLVMVLSFVYDLVCLTFVLWAVKLNKQNLAFTDILHKTIGVVGSKVVLVIFFVLFVSRLISLLHSCYRLFAVTFDVNTKWVVFIIPLSLVSYFAAQRGFNSIARVGQLLVVIIVFSVLALVAFPLFQVNFSELLPIGEAGIDKIMEQSVTHSFWFSDYIFIYFLMDTIKVKKKIFSPVLCCFLLGAAISVVTNMVFVLLYGSLSPEAELAMIKIGLFSVSETTSGRWDWLTLSVWIISVVLKVVIFFFCANKCIEKLFGLHLSNTNGFVWLGITATLIVPLFVSVEEVLPTFIKWTIIPFALVQYLLPLLMPWWTKISNELSLSKKGAGI